MQANIKAKSKSVSLSREIWERVEAVAFDRYAGNRSEYIRQLLEADLAGNGTGESPNDPRDAEAFRRLVRRFLPVFEERAGEWLEGYPENRFVFDLLLELMQAAEAGMSPYQIIGLLRAKRGGVSDAC